MGRFLTGEDLKACFNLFCCVYGVGTLGMPGNYARAGPVYATIALLFMAAANIYASVAISKVMLIAPKNVKTYGDLGQWSMGTFGRYLVVITQMGVCLLVPCVFLVLGGALLDTLFPKAFTAAQWIIFMAISLLPVCLIPTLKEGAFAAAAGCLGTILADVIGLAVLVSNMKGNNIPLPDPDLTFKSVTATFGNLSLAYGAGIVIPALQRQHSDPTRMPRVIYATLGLISVFFLVLSVTGYSVVGCQIPGNLLFAIAGTKLGFTASPGAIVMSYLFMQLHITIAFSIILHPAFYILERLVLKLHPQQNDLALEEANYIDAATPVKGADDEADVTLVKASSSRGSIISIADAERVDEEGDEKDYKAPGAYTKVVILRTVVVALLTVLSVALKDHFFDLQDFVGASTMSLCCMIVPIIFYLKVFYHKMNIFERVFAILVILACTFLGCYVSYTTGKNLFAPGTPDSSIKFPFCEAKYQTMVFTNTTHVF